MTTTADPSDLVDVAIDHETLRATLSNSTRPQRPSAAAASLAFVWRAMLKIKHVPLQLFDVTVFPIMFTLLFTYLFGGQIAGSPSEYIQVLLPGILCMTVTWITMYSGMGLNTDISKGIFDRFRSLPIWRPALLVGMLVADAVRYCVACSVVIALGLVIGFRPDGGVIGVLSGVLLVLFFSFCLSWAWTALAFRAKTPETVMQGAMSVLFPLAFASNVFVDPDTMPGWVQAFVRINPFTHLVTSVRGLMGGEIDSSAMGWTFLWCGVLLVVFAPLTMRLYNNEG